MHSSPLRYFERDTDTGRWRWQISQRASTLTTHFGRVGSPGRTLVRKLKSEAEAEHTLERHLRQKAAWGYVERDAPTPAPEKWAALEAPGDIGRINTIRFTATHSVIAGRRVASSVDGRRFEPAKEAPAGHAYVFVIDDDGTWYAGGGTGGVSWSDDEGKHWHQVKTPALNSEALALFKDNQGTWWLGTDSGRLFSSRTPRSHWAEVTLGDPLARILDIREYGDTLYFAGDGIIARTRGNDVRLPGLGQRNYSRLVRAPSGALLAVGERVLRSTNQGQTWKAAGISGAAKFGTIEFEDAAVIGHSVFVVGGDSGGQGVVARSDDDGRSFRTVTKVDGKLYAIRSSGGTALVGGDDVLGRLA